MQRLRDQLIRIQQCNFCHSTLAQVEQSSPSNHNTADHSTRINVDITCKVSFRYACICFSAVCGSDFACLLGIRSWTQYRITNSEPLPDTPVTIWRLHPPEEYA
jgi:hypothetical protein